jgi:hypothetical protein
VTITAEQWRTVAAVGGGGTVAEVGTRLGLPEFDTCKAVKSLVDSGLAVVTPVAEGQAAPAAGTAADAPADASRSDLVRQLSELRGN